MQHNWSKVAPICPWHAKTQHGNWSAHPRCPNWHREEMAITAQKYLGVVIWHYMNSVFLCIFLEKMYGAVHKLCNALGGEWVLNFSWLFQCYKVLQVGPGNYQKTSYIIYRQLPSNKQNGQCFFFFLWESPWNNVKTEVSGLKIEIPRIVSDPHY